jgi:hypothetical protein
MSTSYYRFKHPITCVRIETEGAHDRVTVWVNHQNTGTLVVDKGTGNDLLDLFEGKQVMHTYHGGSSNLCVVKEDPTLSDDEYVISDYNEVMTVREVLAGKKLVKE